MNNIILRISDEETRRLIQRVQQSGYTSPEAYLRALMEADLSSVELPAAEMDDEALPVAVSGDELLAAIDEADFSAQDIEEMAKAIQQGGRIDHAGW